MGDRTEKDMLKAAEGAARALGTQAQFVEARGPADATMPFLKSLAPVRMLWMCWCAACC